MDYIGTLCHEVNVGNYKKEKRADEFVFSGETEEEIFRKRAKQEGVWWFSTNNGMVPRFTFNQPSMEQRYKTWKANRSRGDAMLDFYGSRPVD